MISRSVLGKNVFLLKPIFAVLGAAIVIAPVRAVGESEQRRGIENVLYLAVASDQLSGLQDANGESMMAKLTVSVLISAHSQETNFFGLVPAKVPEFDLAKGSQSREIWRDGKCHHERGYPKITVTGIDGLMTSRQDRRPVVARARKLGLFLPSDEVLASRRIGNGTDDIGSYVETRTETKKTRFVVDLKLYILPCNLPPGPT